MTAGSMGGASNGAPSRALRTVVAALVLAASLACADVGGAQTLSEPESLAGRLLVALPEMPDPRFAETVIYLVEHDSTGAMGLVINRPMGTLPLAELLKGLNIEGQAVGGDIRLYYGGPVENGQGFVLHSPDYVGKGTRVVPDGLALTADPEIVRDIAAGVGPKQSLFVFGYAGWSPGQLEAEIAEGGWITVPADDTLVFGGDNKHKWRDAMARRSINL
ncbi:MAG: YqgE/AlgH family protein [Alphaproteobacteria bacterium]